MEEDTINRSRTLFLAILNSIGFLETEVVNSLAKTLPIKQVGILIRKLASCFIIRIVIALSIVFTPQDIFYCLVVDRALFGILLKRLADSIPVQSVIITAIIGMALTPLIHCRQEE